MHGEKRYLDLNEALANAGSLGRFQVLVFFLLFMAGIFHGARMTFSYFIQFDPDHRCSIPDWSNDTFSKGDYYHQVAVNESIPPDDFCHVYNVTATFHYNKYHQPINANSSDDLQPCTNGWVYDKSIMREIPTMQFNLVCDRKSVASYVVMAIMAGSLVGAIFFGWISDRYGRQVCLQFSMLLSVVSGVALTWAPNIIAFTVLAAVAAASTSGMFAAAVVTGMEFTLPEYRKISALGMQLFFPVGEIFLSATSFGYRNWKWMNLTITIPALLMTSYYWIVPESPRWLKVNKRYEKLEKVLHKIARFNKRDFPRGPDGEKESLAALLESYHEEEEVRQPLVRDSILNMFTSRVLCLRSLVACGNWYVVNFLFYGLILNSSNLGEGPLLNFLLGALVEFPAQFASFLVVDRLGRKPVHCFYMVLVAISSAVAIGISIRVEGYHWLVLLFALIGKFGAAGLMGTSFLWMAEIFPTSVRGTAVGLMGVSARLGAITVPYIIHMGNEATPFIAFCVVASMAFLAVLTLPETAGRTLPATTWEARSFGRHEEFTPAVTPPYFQDDKHNGAIPVPVQYGSINYKGI